MVCNHCGKANTNGNKFCLWCGQILEQEELGSSVCSSCSAKLPEGAQFCLQCGRPCNTLDSEPELEPIPDSESTPLCTVCGATLLENAQFCLHCGHPCNTLDSEPGLEPIPDPELTPLCTVCGATLLENAQFCLHCGYPCNASDSEPEAAPEQRIPSEKSRESDSSFEPELPLEPEQTPSVCVACGAVLRENALFCSECGLRCVIEESTVEPTTEELILVNCPICHTPWVDHAAFCHYCGNPRSATPPTVESQPPVCERCGTAFLDGTNFCHHCGQSRMPAEATAEKKPEKRGIAWKVWLAVLVTVAIGIAIFVGVYYSEEYMMLHLRKEIKDESARLQCAEEYIMSHHYEEAIGELEGLESKEAEALREYAQLGIKRKNYLESYKSEHAVINEDDEMLALLNRFTANFWLFSRSGLEKYLPPTLRAEFQLDLEEMNKITDYLSDYTSTVYNAQCIYKAFWVKRDHEIYTLAELQSYVDTAQQGIASFEEQYTKIGLNNKLGWTGFKRYYDMCEVFTEAINNNIMMEQKRIDESAEQFEWYESQQMNEPVMDHIWQVSGNGLTTVACEADLYTNCQRMYNTIFCGLVYKAMYIPGV